MKIYTRTFLVLLLFAFSVTAAFSQQDGKTPPKKGDTPVVVAKEKNDQERERQKQEEERKRREKQKPQ